MRKRGGLMRKRITICDGCGKEIREERSGATESGWFRIPSMHLIYRRKDEMNANIPNRFVKKINDCADPDFCCEKCAVKWFTETLSEVKNGECD